jgi:type VI secretion system protein ImpH
MAGTHREPKTDLIQQLLQTPEEFEFFQAVRLIERAAIERAGRHEVNRVGGNEGPDHEAIRFRSLQSLTFPAGQISGISEQKPADRGGRRDSKSGKSAAGVMDMTVSFMGLTGPAGVLPEHYTTLVIERSHLRTKDYALREFLDLFNHRFISLFFRAWEKYRFPFAYERRQHEGHLDDDLFTFCLFCLVGMGSRPLRDRMSFDDHAILYFGGLFASRIRNAVSLQQMLEGYFQIPAEVIEFQGQWLYLPDDCQTAMPSAAHRSGMNLALGETAVAGSRVWDVQSRIRLRLGPLSWREFSDLLPGTPGLACIVDLIRLYIDPGLDFDIQLILNRDEIPSCGLITDSHYRPQLGWNTWTGSSHHVSGDAGDAVFRF